MGGAMELTKQGQRAQPPPLPPPAHRAAQVPCPAAFYPDNRAAQAPTASHPIAPTSHRPAQVSVPCSSEHRPVARPPQQATDFPEMFIPQLSPPSAGKKMAASPKVQMLKSLPSPAGKRLDQKESPPEAHSQVQCFESVRLKFRKALSAALGMDSDRHSGQQSAGNLSPLMSQPVLKRARMSAVHAGVHVSQIGPESDRAIATDEAAEEKKAMIHKAQSVALGIEEELFRLFGGVNKKYKEKGRSLLFNLKDKNNPVLRERVLSGDVTPKCLCAMTTEELASKELSEWRMAKAEELANMVVLPDGEVDVRRLVRKTHKGEFQIEVEEENDVVEAVPGGESISYVPSKHVAVQTSSADKTSVHNEVNESDSSVEDGVARTCNSNMSPSEKSDLMQESMTDDLKVAENLPQIMTMDEFMQLLHSEPHSEYQSTGALQDDPHIDKADKAFKSEKFPTVKHKATASDFQFHSNLPSLQDNCESKLESPMNKSVSVLDPVEEPKGDLLVKSIPEKGSIWEGSIQLGLSTLTNIVAIFRSGEKPSANGWRHSFEIKGRVRFSVFEEFLKQLPNSRSRAIMVTELCWKEGSLESGRHHLSQPNQQTIGAYIGDERVGLVKPAEGVELYLCPQGKAVRILADHLPKEHSGNLAVAGTSIIGLVVWRRPNVSHTVPNRQDVPKSRTTISSAVLPRVSQPTSCSSNACRSHQDVVTTDALPGFGPGAVKDDDDLPEYNFDSVSNSSGDVTPSETHRSHQHTSISEDRMRELVRKYGDPSFAAQPWNRDGDEFTSMVRKYDNLSEWNPNSRSNLQQVHIPQPQFPYEQQLQYHSMIQHDMTREPQDPFPHEYGWHQHFAMPVQQPPPYWHHMHPAEPSYYGVPDHSGESYYGAPDHSGESYFAALSSRTNGAWNQGPMAGHPW